MRGVLKRVGRVPGNGCGHSEERAGRHQVTALSRLLSPRLWLREGVDEIVSDTIGTGLA